MKYLLIDTANTFFRARHSAHRAADSWTKVGFALHVTLMSINKVARRFGADHVIFALEGRSWRKDYYEPYKKNRAVARGKMSETEQEEDKLFWETYDEMTKYLSTKTNCSVIRHPQAEADKQYNGITDELITLEGYFNAKDQPILDKKTKQPKGLEDPQWLLFEKCMRGDTSDNVFSAYPGVREKGTKNKVGLREAFADRDNKGFMWNNLMLQRWTDHEGTEHLVRDDYERNKAIIDLTAQPDHIKAILDQTIAEAVQKERNPSVGPHFMKFCGKYQLQKASDNAQQHTQWLAASYN